MVPRMTPTAKRAHAERMLRHLEKQAAPLKIRYRVRRLASPPEGRKQEWGEYQVVHGRNIVGRFDTLSQAEELMKALT
jgi:hypothetical protein